MTCVVSGGGRVGVGVGGAAACVPAPGRTGMCCASAGGFCCSAAPHAYACCAEHLLLTPMGRACPTWSTRCSHCISRPLLPHPIVTHTSASLLLSYPIESLSTQFPTHPLPPTLSPCLQRRWPSMKSWTARRCGASAYPSGEMVLSMKSWTGLLLAVLCCCWRCCHGLQAGQESGGLRQLDCRCCALPHALLLPSSTRQAVAAAVRPVALLRQRVQQVLGGFAQS